MPIVSSDDLASALQLKRFGTLGMRMSKEILALLKIDKINHMYDQFSHLQGLEFIDAILDSLNVKVEVSECDFKRIPSSGPVLLVSNHPLGGTDGLILLKILLTVRPDSMVMANFLLKKVKPIEEHIIAVNPFETRKELHGNTSGIRQFLDLVAMGQAIAIFPAGEVSTKENRFFGKIVDKTWESSIVKLIHKAKAPVIPVYFHAKNSNLFYILAGLNHNLRTASLPRELVKTKNKTVRVRIGLPVDVAYKSRINDAEIFARELREKIYRLKYSYEKSRFLPLKKLIPSKIPEEIASGSCQDFLGQSILELKERGALLLETNNYELYFTKLAEGSVIKYELGRLREETFRDVGEGTFKALDLDDFDNYYHHLILWNKETKEIIGAYRLGLGDEIYNKYGSKGFYISDLFHFAKEFDSVLACSIEMGRAFIIKSYQQKPLPLFLLLKGIYQITKKYPHFTYLIGPASLSNDFCRYSKSLMVEFLLDTYGDKKFSAYVKPKKKFIPRLDAYGHDICKSGNIRLVEKLVEEMQPNGLKMPVLIKKYLRINAKTLNANVDPSFNNAIDILMYIPTRNINGKLFE
jgi:putative hemolysin